VYKGLGKPIIRDVALEEGVLHIESNKFISIGPAEDSGVGIVSQDLIAHSIGSST
jgi:hypothetical protein